MASDAFIVVVSVFEAGVVVSGLTETVVTSDAKLVVASVFEAGVVVSGLTETVVASDAFSL